MTYLLDVSALMALLWKTHAHNQRVSEWEDGLDLAVCPLSELGFVRISTQAVYGLSVEDARKALKDWKTKRHPALVPCDLAVLDTDAPSAGSKTTDFYLASLADAKGMRLATLDQSINHRAAFVIPN